MKKIYLTGLIMVLALFLAPSAARADQAAYITEKQARKAALFLEKKGAVKHFCAPCGDRQSRFEKIEKIEAVPTGYENYWEVKINGRGIDLAYIYYEKKRGKWKNTAQRMDIEVTDVPRFLPRGV